MYLETHKIKSSADGFYLGFIVHGVTITAIFIGDSFLLHGALHFSKVTKSPHFEGQSPLLGLDWVGLTHGIRRDYLPSWFNVELELR